MEQFIIETQAGSRTGCKNGLGKSHFTFKHAELSGLIVKSQTIRDPGKPTHLRLCGKRRAKSVSQPNIQQDSPHQT